MDKVKIIVIAGPTASGKSTLAMELAEMFNGEIISADSMQVYRYMDIGTAKPDIEQRRKIAHYLIDIVDPDEEFSAARYREDASKAIQKICGKGKNPFVVGGTGLYIKALTKGLFNGPGSDISIRNKLAVQGSGKDASNHLYQKLKEVDPDSSSKIHPNNRARIIRALEVYYLTNKPISSFQKEHNFSEDPYETIKLGLSVDRKFLYKGIEDRVDNMMNAGFTNEVRRLLGMGFRPDSKAMCALGYKEIIGYLQNNCSLESAVTEIKKNTKRYAKRQMTWFRKDTDIMWFPYSEDGKKQITALIERFLR